MKGVLSVESRWLLRARSVVNTEDTVLMMLWVMGSLKSGEARSLPFFFQGRLVPAGRVKASGT